MRPTFRSITINATGPAMRRTFVMLCIGTAFVFVFLGIITMFQADKRINPTSKLGKWTSSFSANTLISVMGQEVPLLSTSVPDAEKLSVSSVFLQMLTSVNPEDPRSFLGRELPGFAVFDGEFMIKGDGIDYTDAPIESPPPAPGMKPPALKEDVTDQDKPDKEHDDDKKKTAPKQTTGGKKRVFIYHTHWYESFLPYLKTKNPDLSFHPEKNITKVGQQFAKELEKLGIGTKVSTKSYDYVDAPLYYTESGKTVQTAMKNDKHLQYFIDIHRDSQRRDKTLATIAGKKYARTMFVVGTDHPKFEENYKLAKKYHEQLQKLYPGLSRGVYMSGGEGVDGVYNQNLSPRGVLIEVGGVDNTFEELNRSARALAEAFAEIYWDAAAVDAKK
ncbi:stage II sporulation protein P [Numidum massiliense]|uniref:stage II sporulation protein P n=1 Tax=Numidum massiliense TaxID=1522315 RepID=UPI0006D52FC8|nr:stage II sporulation protein P [Numidum massiliense]